MDAASEFLARRIERAAVGGGKRRVVRFTPVRGGYTSADRRIVHFADGSSLFVKAATGEDTAGWLRAEQRIYARLTGQPFCPNSPAGTTRARSPCYCSKTWVGPSGRLRGQPRRWTRCSPRSPPSTLPCRWSRT
jgi:hypothetical protein